MKFLENYITRDSSCLTDDNNIKIKTQILNNLNKNSIFI